jgi:hypothetical protein
MKCIGFFSTLCFFLVAASFSAIAQTGKVGINTTTPQAMLHVKDSSVLFSGGSVVSGSGKAPASGQGVRMMWIPDRAAFRAGYVTDATWDSDSIGYFSFASGTNTMAKGTNSTAMGTAVLATGEYSTGIGYGSGALGNFSTAIGNSTAAFAPNSTALGYNSSAYGERSIALGGGTARGFNAIAMGLNSTAAGEFSTAMGAATNAAGTYSTTAGVQTNAKGYAATVVGMYNDSILTVTETAPTTTTPLFIIGNGSGFGNRTNALVVQKNSHVGINNVVPQSALHIKGISPTWDAHIRLETAGTSTDYANILYDGSTKFRNFGADDEFQWRNAANAINMRLTNAGELGLNTASPSALLDVGGTAKIGANGTVLTELIKVTVAKDVASIAANASVTETFAVANAEPGSTVYISPALPLSDGIIIAYARVSVAGTVEVKFTNTTSSSINPPAMNFFVTVIR